jgi:hypothetical protein
MLNPYIFGPNRKLLEDSQIVNQEGNKQGNGRHARHSVALNQLTLRLGMLLIRMGKELTGEKTIQEGSEVPYVLGRKVKTQQARPARLHHA